MIFVFYLALLLFETRYEVQQTLLLLFLFYEKGKKMTSSNSERKYPLFIQKKNPSLFQLDGRMSQILYSRT